MPKQPPKLYDTWHASKKAEKTRTYPLHQSKDDLAATLVSITEFSPEDVAKQITLLDADAFRQIPHSEFFDYGKRKKDCVWIKNCSNRFNQTMFWARAEVLASADCRRRASLLTYFIKVAKHLFSHNNLQGFAAIVTALNSAPISRLKKSWEHVEKKDKLRLEKFVQCINPESNYSNLRNVLPPPPPNWTSAPPASSSSSCSYSQNHSTPTAVVPFLGMFLLELEYLESAAQLNQQQRQKKSGEEERERRRAATDTSTSTATGQGKISAPTPASERVSRCPPEVAVAEKNNNSLGLSVSKHSSLLHATGSSSVRCKKDKLSSSGNSSSSVAPLMGGSGNRRLSTPNQSSSLLLTSNNNSISSSGGGGGGGASSRLREDLSGGGGDKQQRNLHNVKLCNIVNILITYHRYAYYDFEQNPHILNSIKSNSCIEELVKICEADQYKRSLELEPVYSTSSVSSPLPPAHNGTPHRSRTAAAACDVMAPSPSPQHTSGVGGCFSISVGGASLAGRALGHRKSRSVGGPSSIFRRPSFPLASKPDTASDLNSRSSICNGSMFGSQTGPAQVNVLDMNWNDAGCSGCHKASLPTPMDKTHHTSATSVLSLSDVAISLNSCDAKAADKKSSGQKVSSSGSSSSAAAATTEVTFAPAGGDGSNGRKSPSRSEDFILSESSSSQSQQPPHPPPPRSRCPLPIPPPPLPPPPGSRPPTAPPGATNQAFDDSVVSSQHSSDQQMDEMIGYMTPPYDKYAAVNGCGVGVGVGIGEIPCWPYLGGGGMPPEVQLCSTRFPSRHSFDSGTHSHLRKVAVANCGLSSSMLADSKSSPLCNRWGLNSGCVGSVSSPVGVEGLPMHPEDKLVGCLRKKLVLTNGKKTKMSVWKKCWARLSKEGVLWLFPHKVLHAPGGKRVNHYHKAPSKAIDLSVNGWTVLTPSNNHHSFILKSDFLGKMYRFDTGDSAGGGGFGPSIQEWTFHIDSCTDLIKFDSPLGQDCSLSSTPHSRASHLWQHDDAIISSDVMSLAETEDDDDDDDLLLSVGSGGSPAAGHAHLAAVAGSRVNCSDTRPLTPV